LRQRHLKGAGGNRGNPDTRIHGDEAAAVGSSGPIEGQVRSVAKMVEEDRYCIDVVTQINAARAALDKIDLGLLDGPSGTA
jgi:Metal-sensitive transcriptional repressor